MKLFYLRPRRRMPVDYLPESWDYFQRIAANGGTISASTMTAVDQIVRALMENNLWWKILDAGLFVGDQLAAALVKLKFTTGTGVLTNINFVAGDYAEQGANGGLCGDGVTKALRTGLSPSTVGGAAHLSFYAREDLTPGAYQTLLGANSATDDFVLLQTDASVNVRYGQTVLAYRSDLARGFWCGVREDASSLCLYKNGVLQQVTTTPTTVGGTTHDFAVFARNANGTLTNFLDRRGGFYSLGLPLTANDQANLYNAVQVLQQALNRAI